MKLQVNIVIELSLLHNRIVYEILLQSQNNFYLCTERIVYYVRARLVQVDSAQLDLLFRTKASLIFY